MFELNVGIVLRDLGDHASPEAGSREDIRLVDACNLLLSIAREFEGQSGNSLDLVLAIDEGIDGSSAASLFPFPRRSTEVKSAGQLANHHDVNIFDDVGLDWRRVGKRFHHGHWT